MVKFFVMKLIYSVLNHKFSIGVTYLRLIILSVIENITVDNETFFD
jgi:hypothetical protein